MKKSAGGGGILRSRINTTYAIGIILAGFVFYGSVLRSTIIAGSGGKGGNSTNAASGAAGGSSNGSNAGGSAGANAGGNAGQNSGAIFTTDEAGEAVNENIFTVKERAYLGGGPQGKQCGNAGLPDGEYYFQVTDPSGNVLLSSDALAERRVRVAGGVIAEYYGTAHRTSVGACQGLTVGLAPFNDTPNPGGQYKVWMTAAASFAEGQGAFGFTEASSKTDAFKILASKRKKTGTLRGKVFRDVAANGVDDADPGMANVPVSIVGANGLSVTVMSDAAGFYLAEGLQESTYKVCRTLPVRTPAWLQTMPAGEGGCYDVILSAGETVDYLNFGSILLADVQGQKLLDANADGADGGETALPGFSFTLTGRAVSGRSVALEAQTGDDGAFSFTGVLPGSYQLCEVLPPTVPAWLQTFPKGCRSLDLAEGAVVADAIFGNVQYADVSGSIFDDHDADAIRDAADTGMVGAKVSLSGTASNGSVVALAATADGTGDYHFGDLLPGAYEVCASWPQESPAWLSTAPESGSCASLVLQSGSVRDDLDFGAVRLAEIRGRKFYDANANGIDDDGLSVVGWKFGLAGVAVNDLTVNLVGLTGVNGRFSFGGLLPGTYVVSDVPPSGGTWFATTPSSSSLSRGEGATLPEATFGGLCVGSGGGKGLGFWTSKNGEALVQTEDLTALEAMNLRNANGSAFDPVTYASLSSWLLAANATNMANMLSAQLAMLKLNVLNGLVGEGAFIRAVGARGANENGFMTVAALISEADAELGAHGTTLAGSAYRKYQEALKNALEGGTGDTSFVKPSAAGCVVTY